MNVFEFIWSRRGLFLFRLRLGLLRLLGVRGRDLVVDHGGVDNRGDGGGLGREDTVTQGAGLLDTVQLTSMIGTQRLQPG